MKYNRLLCLLLAMLLLGGCSQSLASPPEEPKTPDISAKPDTTAPSEAPAEQSPPETTVAVYDCGTVEIALPIKHLNLMLVETGEADCDADRPLYPRTLMRVYEKATADAAKTDFGDAAGFGFLWGFCEMDFASCEKSLAFEGTGSTIFAQKDGLYYAYLYPTDVQFHRTNLADLQPGCEDFQNWEMLNTLGEEIRADMIQRNGLTPCSAAELCAQISSS